MGMSASQVRYLTLTARIHDVENQAQRIQNQKLLLANDSDEVYQRYLDALDRTKMQVRQFNDEAGTSEMVDVTLEVLYRESCSTLTNGYMLTGIDGSLYLPFELSESDCNGYDSFEKAFAKYMYNETNATVAVNKLHANAQQTEYVKAIWRYINEQSDVDMFNSSGSDLQHFHTEVNGENALVVSNSDQEAASTRYEIIHCICNQDSELDTNWIRDIIGYGYANFQMLSSEPSDVSVSGHTVVDANSHVINDVEAISLYSFASSTVSTDTQMGEMADEVELAKAEVEYESDMKKINAKDKRYDTELSTLENQRSAMKEEMQSMKTVIKENIDRTFKIFT